MAGLIPYWGANGIVDHINDAIFDEELVLLGEDGAPFGDPFRDVAFRVTGRIWVNNHIHVLRPGPGTEARFLTYALNTVDWTPFVSGSTRDKLTQEDMKKARVPLWEMSEQLAIANFLDSETARIDGLIAKKRRTVDVLKEREASCRQDWFERLSAEHGQVRLRRLVSRLEQGWSPVCDTAPATEDEWGVLKTSAVSTGVFRADENKRLPSGVAPDLRWVVEDGDLLMTRGSGSIERVGMASVARVSMCKVTISDLIYRAKLLAGSPEFVAAALVAPQGRDQIERAVRSDVGQTLKVRADDLKEVRVPAVAAERQEEQWRSLAPVLAAIETVTVRLERQINLLTERRQALITGAVTGELAVARPIADEAS